MELDCREYHGVLVWLGAHDGRGWCYALSRSARLRRVWNEPARVWGPFSTKTLALEQAKARVVRMEHEAGAAGAR